VLGGTGFVGSRLVTRLMADGHRVKVLTRNREAHRHLLVLPDVDLVNADVHDPGQLAQHFAGVERVINLVGILNERGRNGAGFRRVHVELARQVVAAARSMRVGRVLHMSALGADRNAPSHYLRTKALGEEAVRKEAGDVVEHVIFRPSVIFGPGDSFIERFAHLARMIPLVFPLARANAKFAPVYVGDVVEAQARCVRSEAAAGEVYELCGPDVFTLREIVEFTVRTIGRRRRVLGLPDFIGRLQAFIMDFLPGKPFSTDNYRSLTVDSVCQVNGFGMLGLQPRSMNGLVRQYLGKSALLDEFRHFHHL
jgi:NADH dehydrogenase